QYPRAGGGGAIARHRRGTRFRRQPGDGGARPCQPAQRRPLHHLRLVRWRARPAVAADRAARNRHHRLIRRQPAGTARGRRAREERQTEAAAGQHATRRRGERRARGPEGRPGDRAPGAGFRSGGRMSGGASAMTFNWTNPYAWPRKPVLAANAVATSQPLAAQAGLQMLAEGGSAVDAILATAITLTLVEPVSNGIGSDAYAILWDGKELHGLNASGRSPAAWSLDYFRGQKTVPVRGWNSVSVPG